jgi:hypothetical protein
MSDTSTPAAELRPKPLGMRCYGSIPHLPGSKVGPGEYTIEAQQAQVFLEKVRNRHDLIFVQEKLDGTNVAVAKKDGQILALMRAGHLCWNSRFEQHHLFAAWAAGQEARFQALLAEGERLVGEWLAQAHGTRYRLTHEPFVAFDLMREHQRLPYAELQARLSGHGFVTPRLVHTGKSFPLEELRKVLEPSGHGAEEVEGAVYRWETREGDSGDARRVVMVAKWVRGDYVAGRYLPEIAGRSPLWNWRPERR